MSPGTWKAIAQVAAAIVGKVEGNKTIVSHQNGKMQSSGSSIVDILNQSAKIYNGINSSKTTPTPNERTM